MLVEQFSPECEWRFEVGSGRLDGVCHVFSVEESGSSEEFRTRGHPMNRISTCIRKAYARVVLFAIRPALRVEQEIREEEWRSLGRQISVVVSEQIAKRAVLPRQRVLRTAEGTGSTLASRTGEEVSREGVR